MTKSAGDDGLVIWVSSARSPESASIARYKKRIRGSDHMPKAYWITTYREIKDPAKLAAYSKLAPLALAPFGVKYLVRGAAVAASEAGIKQRVVISVFDSVAKAVAAHDSPAYQAAVKVLGDGAERDVRIVEGLE